MRKQRDSQVAFGFSLAAAETGARDALHGACLRGRCGSHAKTDFRSLVILVDQIADIRYDFIARNNCQSCGNGTRRPTLGFLLLGTHDARPATKTPDPRSGLCT